MAVTDAAPASVACVGLPDRLDFMLPDFTRVSWASDAARSVWEPRIAAIVKAWHEVEWRSVVDGVRRCAVTMATPEDLVARGPNWAEHGLNILPVELSGVVTQPYASTSEPYRAGQPVSLRLVLGRPPDVVRFKRAWNAADQYGIGDLLGYPPCCRTFFQAVWVGQGMVDTTWPMAVRSTETIEDGRTAVVDGPPHANILWRWMGPRAVFHLPCRVDCAPSLEVGKQLIDVGSRHGFGQEMDWLLEVLSWPVEWSALHGIAEIQTPILKVSTRTDAGGTKCIVRRSGTAYPAEGSSGLGFPYRTWSGTPVTESVAYQRGLCHPLPVLSNGTAARSDAAVGAAWLATDNGFVSEAAMREAHAPIVLLASRVLGDGAGAVLDLGCGNGALLKSIADLCRGVSAHGVERDAERIRHAQHLWPDLAATIVEGDIFQPEATWSNGRRYALALLMPGRLLEAEPTQAAQLRTWLAAHCDRIVVYAYGDWLTRYGSLVELARQAGLGLQGTVREAGDAAAALATLERTNHA